MRMLLAMMIAFTVTACGTEHPDDAPVQDRPPTESVPASASLSSPFTDPAAAPAGAGKCFHTACTTDAAGDDLCVAVCGGAAICGRATGLCGTGTPCCTLQ